MAGDASNDMGGIAAEEVKACMDGVAAPWGMPRFRLLMFCVASSVTAPLDKTKGETTGENVAPNVGESGSLDACWTGDPTDMVVSIDNEAR